MRLCVVFTKGPEVRFVSHLDVQRLMQRAFRRAKLPLAFSQGFNPHPLVSFATALSVGMTSSGEYLDVTLTEDMPVDGFISAVSAVLPKGVSIVEAFDMGDSRKSLTSAMRSACYTAKVRFDREQAPETIEKATAELLSGEIVVMKKTKGGIKPTDIRPWVYELKLDRAEGNEAVFTIRGLLSAEGGLNPDMLLSQLYGKLGAAGVNDINRDLIEMDRAALIG